MIPDHKLDAAIRGMQRMMIAQPKNELAPDLVDMLSELKERRTKDRNRSDAAVAIGEDAFRSGFEAGLTFGLANTKPLVGGAEMVAELDKAWSDYDPPEDIKALS